MTHKVKDKTSPAMQKAFIARKLILGAVLTFIFGAMLLNAEGDGRVFGLLGLVPATTLFVLGIKHWMDYLES